MSLQSRPPLTSPPARFADEHEHYAMLIKTPSVRLPIYPPGIFRRAPEV